MTYDVNERNRMVYAVQDLMLRVTVGSLAWTLPTPLQASSLQAMSLQASSSQVSSLHGLSLQVSTLQASSLPARRLPPSDR